MLLLGDYDDIVDNNIDIYEKEGWTLVDYNLNKGAGGKYIYLYYTIDAWDYPRGITSIAFNDDSFGAVCGNGSTTPQDINEGAGGDYIYMH